MRSLRAAGTKARRAEASGSIGAPGFATGSFGRLVWRPGRGDCLVRVVRVVGEAFASPEVGLFEALGRDPDKWAKPARWSGYAFPTASPGRLLGPHIPTAERSSRRRRAVGRVDYHGFGRCSKLDGAVAVGWSERASGSALHIASGSAARRSRCRFVLLSPLPAVRDRCVCRQWPQLPPGSEVDLHRVAAAG